MIRINHDPAYYPSKHFFELSYLFGDRGFAPGFVLRIRDRMPEASYVIKGKYF